MYEYQDDSRFRKLPARLYSSLELIELVKSQFDENVSTIEDARQVIRMNNGYLDKFVRKMFTTDDRPNPDAQIMNMRKFNNIDLETLFNFLSDIVNDMPVADLMTDDFGTLSMYTDKFWHKIVVEVAHNS